MTHPTLIADETVQGTAQPSVTETARADDPVPASSHPVLLEQAGITRPDIPDEGRPFHPRDTASPPPEPAAIFPKAFFPQGTFDPKSSPRHHGVRLLPLEGFFWGYQGATARPRVRGDHAILWLWQGKMRLGLPRNDRITAANWLWSLPAGTAFSAMPLVQTKGVALLFPPELLPQDISATLTRHVISAPVHPGDHAGLTAALAGIDAETKASGGQAQTALTLHLRLLAVQIGRIKAVKPHDAPRTGITCPQAEDRRLVAQFVTLCDREMGQGRTLAEMAGHLDVSLAELDAACLRQRGQNALALVYEQRHLAAVRLLRQTKASLTEIASSLGYTSLPHFIRSFVAATGRSPDQFRIDCARTTAESP